jgi:hypothetical protein
LATSLIQEIQREAMKSDMQIDELLRMMKLATAKLNLDGIEGWVEQELDGYSETVPEYRSIHGRPYAWNPYNGWIPIMFDEGEIMERLSEAPVRQSIGSLGEMLAMSSDGEFHFPIPQHVVITINQVMNFETPKAIIKIARGDLVSLIGKVRNMILDWSIEMEKKGVLGDGMTFNSDEKEQARIAMTTFNVGDIQNFTGNLGTQNTSAEISSNASDLAKLIEAAQKIRAAISQMELGKKDEERLTLITTTLENEAEKTTPDNSKLKSLLEDGRSVLTGAVGNLTAEGVLALLSSLLKG